MKVLGIIISIIITGYVLFNTGLIPVEIICFLIGIMLLGKIINLVMKILSLMVDIMLFLGLLYLLII